MKINYNKYSKIYKAMADSNRLKIIDMLSNGELCVCDLLSYFDLSQSTLSHHLRVLMEAKVVKGKKRGKWHYYYLNSEFVQQFLQDNIQLLLSSHPFKNQECSSSC